MRYRLNSLSAEKAKSLGGDLSLTDEITLARMTVQDLVELNESAADLGQRVMTGSMLRDAIELLSRLIERAARLPDSPSSVSIEQVESMLNDIQSTIIEQLPDGVGRQQLIQAVKGRLEGISNRETHTALILRTCEAMDLSVPKVEEGDIQVGYSSTEESEEAGPRPS